MQLRHFIQLHIWLAALVFLDFATSSVCAQTDLDLPPPMRPEVRALLEDYGTDAPYADVKRYMEVERELATRPDIKQDLINDFKRSLIRNRQNPGNVAASMSSALPLRADLTADEQKLVTDELERVIEFSNADYFIGPAINMMRHYPSPEHEVLVLRFLQRDDRASHIFLAAFRTLASIGGPKSLRVMRQMEARFAAKNPKYEFLKKMNEYIGALATRIEQMSSARVPARASDVSDVEKSQKRSNTTGSSSIAETSANEGTGNWFVWAVVIIGIVLTLTLSSRLLHRR